jgi:hypothetical protein
MIDLRNAASIDPPKARGSTPQADNNTDKPEK